MNTNTITLEEARNIAYEWHGGGGSPLYSFASTSHTEPSNITPATVKETDDNIAWCIDNPDTEEASGMGNLLELYAFLIVNMPPQDDNE